METNSSPPQENPTQLPERTKGDPPEAAFTAEELRKMTSSLDPDLLALLGLC